jgi:phosphoribosylformimino-5-aminoimidazole carboxamide ribotide isomerase
MVTARPFELMPAIDLRGGRVVRLEQGDFQRETEFSADPPAVARRFAGAGARLLHVVDLDGAAGGAPTQLDALRAIAIAAGPEVRVEAAGGIRSAEAAAAAFDAGAARVVFGTVAIRDPGVVRDAVATHGSERVAIAVDVRGDAAVGEAWRPDGSGPSPDELIRRLSDVGVALFEVTAIDRDGLLGGPDLRLLERLVGLEAGSIVASGGIRDVADVLAVRDLGCAGAIVGRALYDGTFDLRAAIERLAPVPG